MSKKLITTIQVEGMIYLRGRHYSVNLKFVNITPHGPDEGSVEPKRYSVDPSIKSFLPLGSLLSVFLHTYIYIYIYIIYIYIYVWREKLIYIYNIYIYCMKEKLITTIQVEGMILLRGSTLYIYIYILYTEREKEREISGFILFSKDISIQRNIIAILQLSAFATTTRELPSQINPGKLVKNWNKNGGVLVIWILSNTIDNITLTLLLLNNSDNLKRR